MNTACNASDYNNGACPIVNRPIVNPIAGASLSDVKVSMMTGSLMTNIGDFVKKNAIMLGVGALALGAGIYLLVRKKNARKKTLSGLTRTHKPKRTHKPQKQLKSLKLS